ncbi:hypothetical protein GCM10020219_034110 [Nonomuraea dietziae]
MCATVVSDGGARPRIHDPELILDTAERLVAGSGPDGVTIRGLAAATGMSNGAIYHSFESLPALLGRVWLRAANDFLDLQSTLVQQALNTGGQPATAMVEAVVAAADAPAVFALRRPAAARMLMGVRREQLLGPDLPDQLAADLFALDRRLLALLSHLIQGKLTPAAAIASMATGHRFSAPEARDLGLVDDVAELDRRIATADGRVRPLAGKDRTTLAAIKTTMFASALAALRDTQPAPATA